MSKKVYFDFVIEGMSLDAAMIQAVNVAEDHPLRYNKPDYDDKLPYRFGIYHVNSYVETCFYEKEKTICHKFEVRDL